MNEPKLTRCPGCGTVFRVTPAQLALREGQVRCGHCRAVFDANDHVVSLDIPPADDFDADDELLRGRPTVTLRSADALLPAPPATPVSAADDADATAGATQSISDRRADEQSDDVQRAQETSADEGTVDERAADAVPAAAGLLDQAPADSASRVAVADAAGGDNAIGGDAPIVAPAAGQAPAGEGATEATVTAEGAAAATAAGTGTAADGSAAAGTAGQGSDDQGTADERTGGEGTADGVPASEDATAEAAAATGSDAAIDAGASAAPIAPIDLRESDRLPSSFEWKQRRQLGEPSRRVYAAAIGVLVVALALQLVLEFRDALAARVPATRPLLAGACRLLACEIAPMKDTAALSIEASDLQADPAHRGLLVLSATIRNRAAHPIAYPYLELTLTDSSERIVVRRAFAPQEYAGGTADLGAGMAANGERLVKLFIDASATQQAGYQLYLFYP